MFQLWNFLLISLWNVGDGYINVVIHIKLLRTASPAMIGSIQNWCFTPTNVSQHKKQFQNSQKLGQSFLYISTYDLWMYDVCPVWGRIFIVEDSDSQCTSIHYSVTLFWLVPPYWILEHNHIQQLAPKECLQLLESKMFGPVKFQLKIPWYSLKKIDIFKSKSSSTYYIQCVL